MLNKRARLYAFIICILISSLLWLLIKLSSNFKNTTVFPLVIKSPFISKIIVGQTIKSLAITSKSQGFKISIANYFIKKKPIIINLSKLNFTKNDNELKAKIILSKYINQIFDSLDIGDELISVNPDTISLSFQEVISKSVPVHLNLSIDFDKQYDLYRAIKYEPDSITITGLKKDVSNISYLSTEYKYLKNVNKSNYINLKIYKPPHSEKLTLSCNSIIAYLPVAKFTEGSVNVPVTVINNSKQKVIRVFPNNIRIIYLVSLSDYNKVSPLMFVAAIDFQVLKKSEINKTKVQLIDYPDFVRITKINPEKVEYIIW